jgi:hypothetical protein
MKGEMALEKEHFQYHRAQEIEQVRTFFSNELRLTGRVLIECNQPL